MCCPDPCILSPPVNARPSSPSSCNFKLIARLASGGTLNPAQFPFSSNVTTFGRLSALGKLLPSLSDEFPSVFRSRVWRRVWVAPLTFPTSSPTFSVRFWRCYMPTWAYQLRRNFLRSQTFDRCCRLLFQQSSLARVLFWWLSVDVSGSFGSCSWIFFRDSLVCFIRMGCGLY